MGFDARFATYEIDPEIAAAVLEAIEVLEDLGAEMMEVQLPDMDQYSAAWPVLCSAEAAAAHQETYPSRKGEYGPWFRDWLEMGTNVTGAQYAKANKLRAECSGHLRRVFEQVDFLVCPTMGRTAPSGHSGRALRSNAPQTRSQAAALHGAFQLQRRAHFVLALRGCTAKVCP